MTILLCNVVACLLYHVEEELSRTTIGIYLNDLPLRGSNPNFKVQWMDFEF